MYKKFGKAVKVIGMALAVMALVVGCGSDKSTSQPNTKVIRVAGEVTYPPFEYAEDGKFKGFDVDLANAIGEKIGYQVEYVSMGFDALIPALQSNQIDAIISGLVITPEREQKIFFSTPYWKDYNVAVVKESNNSIHTKADLGGKTSGAQIATTGVTFIEEEPGAKAVQFDTITVMLDALKQDQIESAIVNGPVANYYIQKGGLQGLKTVNIGLPVADLGIGINKNNPELLEKVNKALAELKADGTYEKLAIKWFGEAVYNEQKHLK